MHVLIPYTPVDPKSRLDPVLSPEERLEFARAMLDDVVDVVTDAGHTPIILATATMSDPPAELRVDERSLSTAVNAALEPPMAIVMADMPLLTPEVVAKALSHSTAVTIGPGRGGGTNLLVVRDDRFCVDYHGASLVDHRQIAADAKLDVFELDSHRIATDIDEATDLVEVLLHGDGRASRWLREHGFELVGTDGRVIARRT